MVSPFEVLAVDPDADEETVRRAYRRRAMETHPDRGGSVEEFRRVREAYEAVVTGEVTHTDGTVETADDAESGGRGPRRDDVGSEPEPGVRAPGVGASGRRGRAADGAAVEQAHVEYLNYEVVEDCGWALAGDDLFERAAGAGLGPEDYGTFLADGDELLLSAAEAQGHRWPFACRGGACANCAVYVAEGAVETTVDNVLSEELHDAGFRLSCICKPATERLQLVYNVKHLPGLEEFRLPATRFERARSGD